MAKLKWCKGPDGTYHGEIYCTAGEVCTEWDGNYLVDEKEIKDEPEANPFSFCPYCGKSLNRK